MTTRVWRVCKEASLPFPFPEEADEFQKYLIAEAIYLKVMAEDVAAQKAAEKAAEKERWQSGPVGSGKPGEGGPPGTM